MIDAASGGSFVEQDTSSRLNSNCQPRRLMLQQYEDIRHAPQQVNEVSVNSNLVDQISKLTSCSLSGTNAKRGRDNNRTCGVCSLQGHMTDQCPEIAENQSLESVNAVGYQGGQFQQRNNPFSATYNEGWRNRPNFRWSNNENILECCTRTVPQAFFKSPRFHRIRILIMFHLLPIRFLLTLTMIRCLRLLQLTLQHCIRVSRI